jgi:hypothetical protein
MAVLFAVPLQQAGSESRCHQMLPAFYRVLLLEPTKRSGVAVDSAQETGIQLRPTMESTPFFFGCG